MTYLYLKAIHIVFVVCWFAGIFYLPRLFIYNIEAQEQPDSNARAIMTKQFNVMAKRLWYGITIPSAVISLITGTWLLIERGYWRYLFEGSMLWLLIKLILVVLFYWYNYSLHKILQQQLRNVYKITSQQLRIWNEVATVILVAVVFLAVVKSSLSLLYALVGIILLIAVLFAAIDIYKKIRLKQNKPHKEA
ncbi:CopD family protein [Haoranjiania flava]|uniref:Protoporphyrinogen IX oxidase n=1 Tax=Haoranjiania flava TaxID=1856322 RepID=A0AAE3LJ45_9BACT|nr:CopD family protein [Haoranjiania flava]MCU7693238.1 CopD family protein [Haoranjiania flava]